MDAYRAIVEASTTLCRSRPESASARGLSDAVPPGDHAALGHNIIILAGYIGPAHKNDTNSTARSYKWCTMEPLQLGTPSSRFSQKHSLSLIPGALSTSHTLDLLSLTLENEIKHPLRLRLPSHSRILNPNRQTNRRQTQRLFLPQRGPP